MAGRATAVWALLTAGLAACTTHRTSQPEPPPAAAVSAGSGLQVALLWNAPVDLDLYVTDPTWETVYFANTPTRTGARLVRDTRCTDVTVAQPSFVELAALPDPLPGPYRVGVDFIDACSARHEPVSLRIVIDYGGVRREATQTIRLEEFQPIVVEFELRAGPDGALTLVQEGR